MPKKGYLYRKKLTERGKSAIFVLIVTVFKINYHLELGERGYEIDPEDTFGASMHVFIQHNNSSRNNRAQKGL
jgi:hypothetical protein